MDRGPREKLQHEGASSAADVDLIAALLGTGSRGEHVSVLAARVVRETGSLHALSKLSVRELTSIRGVGASKACRLVAAAELGRRASAPRSSRPEFSDALSVYAHFAHRLQSLRTERFFVVGVDARNRLVAEREVALGGRAECLVDVCEAFRPLIAASAQGALFVHNHPSGSATPSTEDHTLTTNLIQASELLRIRFVDHIVIGHGEWYSFEAGRRFVCGEDGGSPLTACLG